MSEMWIDYIQIVINNVVIWKCRWTFRDGMEGVCHQHKLWLNQIVWDFYMEGGIFIHAIDLIKYFHYHYHYSLTKEIWTFTVLLIIIISCWITIKFFLLILNFVDISDNDVFCKWYEWETNNKYSNQIASVWYEKFYTLLET